jgi:hypothetical protein
MTDKSSILRAFNTHFFDFIEDLLGIFPNNNDLVVAKTSFDTIKKANPTAIIKSWVKFVYHPYKDVIDNGDISFFFDKDYSDDLSSVSNANKILNIIDTLREPIKEMGDANKEHTTKYIQNLSKLSMLYNDM